MNDKTKGEIMATHRRLPHEFSAFIQSLRIACVASLILLGAPAAAENGMLQGPVIESLMLDSNSLLGPSIVKGSEPLEAGYYYILKVEGTFSAWPAPHWEPDPCAGEPEEMPQFPSEGSVVNGKVGLDARFIFSWPVTSPSLCGTEDFVPPVGPHEVFSISLDGGLTGFVPEPLDPYFHSDHVYRYLLRGEGQPLQAALNSAPSEDDYGQLRLMIGHAVREVSIDIMPGSDTNVVTLGSSATIPVAILSDPDFDASTIDPETLNMAGAGVRMVGRGRRPLCRMRDASRPRDGLDDLVCRIVNETTVQVGSTMAVVEGRTFGGGMIRGQDGITVVERRRRNPRRRGGDDDDDDGRHRNDDDDDDGDRRRNGDDDDDD